MPKSKNITDKSEKKVKKAKETSKPGKVVSTEGTADVNEKKPKKIPAVRKKSIKKEVQPEVEEVKLPKEPETAVLKKARGRPKKVKVLEVPKEQTQPQAVVPPVKAEGKDKIKPVAEVKPVVKAPEKERVEPVPPAPAPKKVQLHKVKINELTTVREISAKISVPVNDLIKKLLSMKMMATINQRLEPDIVTLLMAEFGCEAEFVSLYQEEDLFEVEEDPAKLKHRAPIVTVMGHVDHGKTTLLDTIRKAKVAEKEHGGITQHIGAYKVHTPKGDIVFLDTPGHEAFTSMRAHGTKITDIVVLVVSADDGVMPQTIEAIDHARVANVPIIVAINKIDLPNVNPQNIKQQLTQHNLVPDDWGGDTLMVEVSARNNVNIDKLLEAILFKAELLDLKSNPDKPAYGVIIESHLDPRRGPLPTVLVQAGTLGIGDVLVSGMTSGKVRALLDEYGQRALSAKPSTPVEVMGFDSLPRTGDKFIVIKDERVARDIVKRRKDIVLKEKSVITRRISLDDLSSGKIKQLNTILKTDVSGSLDAIRDTLERISHEEVEIRLIHSGIGAINETDVNLAIASGAVIIGFNITPTANASSLAKDEGVDIRIYRIIYQLVDDIKKALAGLSTPKLKEVVTGHAEIRKIYKISDIGAIAGCFVRDGKVARAAKVRVLRDNIIVFEGNVGSLKRFKDDVKEVEKGYECGIQLESYNDIKVGDFLEFLVSEEIKPE